MNKIIFVLFFITSFNALSAGTSSNKTDEVDNSNQINILYQRAENYIANKDFKKSIKVLKGLTKREDLSGFRADIYNLLGYSYRKIDKPNLDKSFAAYMMALEINPNHIGAHEYLGELYLTLGKKEKAIEMLNRLKILIGVQADEYIDLKEAIENYS